MSVPIHAESNFEQEIVAHLVAHGWLQGDAKGGAPERAIALPPEHRTALIAEAVTGKLRVPGA